MSEEKTHDLYDFMKQLSDEMAAEYDRIQKRATEDPGTAGDQGEENWAELLRGWLPSTYKVVTKGRIISQDGITSPQVDVLVLKDVYPKKLLNKKLYLAAGVVAAFECKTTLKAEHIEKAAKTCVEIKNLYPERQGSPYRELHAPIVYGLLAHSHSWKSPNSTPEDNVESKLRDSNCSYVTHPRLCLDLLCVADLATWTLYKTPFNSQLSQSDPKFLPKDSKTITWYGKHLDNEYTKIKRYITFGALVSKLWQRLAWEEPAFRDLSSYFHYTRIGGNASGKPRYWQSNMVFTQEVLSGFGTHGPLTGEANRWSEWFSYFG